MSKKVTPQELRIGNWVKDRGGKTLRIDWLEKDKICSGGVFNGMPVHPFTEYFDYLQPIELTPEILEAAGFERETPNDKYGKVYKLPDCKFIVRIVNYAKGVSNEDWGFAIELSDENNWCGVVNRVEYLHTLQNIFYFITGHNLTIKF